MEILAYLFYVTGAVIWTGFAIFTVGACLIFLYRFLGLLIAFSYTVYKYPKAIKPGYNTAKVIVKYAFFRCCDDQVHLHFKHDPVILHYEGPLEWKFIDNREKGE